MKKVIILSYFFPPSVFVGGQRTEYWAKKLHRFGYYPVIITRNWNKGQTTLTEEVTENELVVEKFETHEIHRLPYKRTLRDKLAEKKGMGLFQKTLTLWEIFASNFTIRAIPYRNIYFYTDQLLKQDKYHALIASGRPFQTFYLGHKLKKKHQVLWIPDYRDEWNSHYRVKPAGILRKLIAGLEKRSEKNWTSNADGFLTVSEPGKRRIEAYTGKRGFVVKNGFDQILQGQQRTGSKLKILYAGTLYPYQDLSIIIESIIQLNNSDIEFHLIGSFDTPELKKDYSLLMEKHPQFFKYTSKVSKSTFEQRMLEMDIGMLTPYKNLDGCLPVKTFDYYAGGLQLLLCGNDNDIIEQFILETKSGAVVEDIESCKDFLELQLDLKNTGKTKFTHNYELGRKHSREFQTEELANVLDFLLSQE